MVVNRGSVLAVYTKTDQVHDSGMSEDVEYYHTFLKICNDITVFSKIIM